MRLPAAFADTGLLPNPDLEVAVAIGGEAINRTVELARSLLPGIPATGAATEEVVDVDTLAERLRADTGAVGRALSGRPWSVPLQRRPCSRQSLRALHVQPTAIRVAGRPYFGNTRLIILGSPSVSNATSLPSGL